MTKKALWLTMIGLFWLGTRGDGVGSSFLSSGVSRPTAQPKTFHWGVNGHPAVQEGYTDVPIAAQLDLVAQLGARWYRCDWYQASFDSDPGHYDSLVREARRRGIRILPVIVPTINCRTDTTTEQIRAGCFEFAQAITARYRGRVTHWELDNELDLVALLRKGDSCPDGTVWAWDTPGGYDPYHYEETRYQRCRAELLGLGQGVKAADPQAHTLVNAAEWLHYGFFERLIREDKVPFDILAWHWYSEMGESTRAPGHKTNVHRKLLSYGKPIWITEISRRSGSMDDKEQEQAKYLASAARQFSKLPGVRALFAYELLDEPYLGADDPESYHGLVQIVRGLDGRWRIRRHKDAFHAYRQVTIQSKKVAKRRDAAGRVSFRDLPNSVRERAGLINARCSAEIQSSPFGTHTSSLWERHEADRIAEYLQEVAAVGFKWVKDYIHGAVGEGEDWREKTWQFSPHYEAYLRTAAALGLRVLLRVDFYFHGKLPTTPEARQAMACHYRQAVRCFKPWVRDWEIYNEPNLGNENPHISPEDYVQMVQTASAVIRAEDPQARVYAPAVAMLQCLHTKPFPYIPKLLEAGLLDHIDVFSFHPYRQPYVRVNIPEHGSEFHPWRVWGSYAQQIADLRARLGASTGREIPLAATEEGYPTHMDRETSLQEITLVTQAKYEQRAMLADFLAEVRTRINFIFKRPFVDPYGQEANFNLVNPDNSKRPAYFAAQNICAVFDDTLKRAPFSVSWDAPRRWNTQVHAFIQEHPEYDELLIVLWAGVPARRDGSYYFGSCRLAVDSDRYLAPVVFDLLQPTPIPAVGQPYRVEAGRLFIEQVPVNDSPVLIKAFAIK